MSRNTYFSPFDDNAFDYINDFEIFDRPTTTVSFFHCINSMALLVRAHNRLSSRT